MDLFLWIMINTEAKEKDLTSRFVLRGEGRLIVGFLGSGFSPAWRFVAQGSSTPYPLSSLALKQCICLSPTSCFWSGDIFLKFWLWWGLWTNFLKWEIQEKFGSEQGLFLKFWRKYTPSMRACWNHSYRRNPSPAQASSPSLKPVEKQTLIILNFGLLSHKTKRFDFGF